VKSIRLERDGNILRVTIDRPDDARNAVDGVLHAELTELFGLLRVETEARAVVLTGAGGAFSAGGDFRWFPTLQEPGALEHLRLDAKRMLVDLLEVPLPIVCALNGHAVGLGASLALLSDVVVMAESATISDPHVRVGVVAGDGGTVAWPLAVGPMLAKRYLLTGDPVDAPTALRLGLAAEVVPDDRLDEVATALARRLADGAPLAIRYTKQAVNAHLKDAVLKALDVATALETVTFRSDDHAEALAAIREKRVPRFEGR
jgi:enoyl-CoA hydratase